MNSLETYNLRNEFYKLCIYLSIDISWKKRIQYLFPINLNLTPLNKIAELGWLMKGRKYDVSQKAEKQ